MLDAAKPYLFRIIGPNTVGLMIPPMKLNASFAHMAAKPGNIALLSQSGAIATSLDRLGGRQRCRLLAHRLAGRHGRCRCRRLSRPAGRRRARRARSSCISKRIPNARKFMSAARAAARIKPVIAIKSGRHEAGRQSRRDPYRRAVGRRPRRRRGAAARRHAARRRAGGAVRCRRNHRALCAARTGARRHRHQWRRRRRAGGRPADRLRRRTGGAFAGDDRTP